MDAYLQDNEGKPQILFHYTRHDFDFENILPFTHFGTCQAANERWHGNSAEGMRFIPAILKISNPLRIKDSGDMDIFFGIKELIGAGVSREKLEWIYQPLLQNKVSKSEFHNAANAAHSWNDFDPNTISLTSEWQKTAINDFLKEMFGLSVIKPMKLEKVKKELHQEGIFPTEARLPYSRDEQITEQTVRRWLKDQRKIIALEELGYDGLVYENKEEDYGHDSYCIFRARQVVSAFSHEWGHEGMPKAEVDFQNYRLGWIDFHRVFSP